LSGHIKPFDFLQVIVSEIGYIFVPSLKIKIMYTMKITKTILSLSFALTAIFANAQVNLVERADDRKDLAVDRAQKERDQKEIAAFQSDLAGIETAWKSGDANKVNALKNQLVAAMKREIEQSENKLSQDKKEVREDNAEIRSDNREIRRDRRDSRVGVDVRDDARDKARDKADRRDDIRDKADDVNDKNEQAGRLARQKNIYETLKAYHFANLGEFSKGEAATKRMLANEFLETMQRDLAETYEEISEDKRELREDRRETRDDRRERRERK
jgi:hypothetical protein